MSKCKVCGGSLSPSALFPHGGSFTEMCVDCNSYQQKLISERFQEPSEEEKLRKREAYFKGRFQYAG